MSDRRRSSRAVSADSVSKAVDEADAGAGASSPVPAPLNVTDVAILRRAALAYDEATETDTTMRALERMVEAIEGIR